MDEVPASLKLIQWICFTTRPLSLDELRGAMIVDPEYMYNSIRQYQDAAEYDCDGDMENRLKTLSCGLAEVVPSAGSCIVQFVHQSARDFLIDQGLAILMNSPKSAKPGVTKAEVIASAHHQLSRTCIRYFTMDEIEQWSAGDRDDLISEHHMMHFAESPWIGHAQASEAGGLPQHDLIHDFGWPSKARITVWQRVFRALDRSWQPNPLSLKMTLMHVASCHGLLEVLRLLIDQGAEVDVRDQDGHTPLRWAARRGHKDVMELLLRRGAQLLIL